VGSWDLTEYSEEGVELTPIRSFLALTPAQRLEFVTDRFADLEQTRAHQRGR